MLPEALHQVTIVMSDRGIPKSYRHMHGFGSHTFSMISKDNVRTWVKFHFRCLQDIENLSDDQAKDIVGEDRESSQRDLVPSIASDEFPRWKLCIQVMTDDQAKRHKHNPFDLTKVWPKADYPLIEVGVMELNRNPASYFQDVEQAAFSPANLVPGISHSPDKMLKARLFAYGDSQRYRLGINFNHIPVNAPVCPVHTYHRDGQMRVDGNGEGKPTYFPNNLTDWHDQPELAEPPLAVDGAAAHWDHRLDEDYYEQPGNLFRLMPRSANNCCSITQPARSSMRTCSTRDATLRTVSRPTRNMAPAWPRRPAFNCRCWISDKAAWSSARYVKHRAVQVPVEPHGRLYVEYHQ